MGGKRDTLLLRHLDNGLQPDGAVQVAMEIDQRQAGVDPGRIVHRRLEAVKARIFA
jgi:hypothetical protein